VVKKGILEDHERTIAEKLLTIPTIKGFFDQKEDTWLGMIKDAKEYVRTTETDKGDRVELIDARKILCAIVYLFGSKYDMLLDLLDKELISGPGLAPRKVQNFDELKIEIPGESEGFLGRCQKLLFLFLGLIAEENDVF